MDDMITGPTQDKFSGVQISDPCEPESLGALTFGEKAVGLSFNPSNIDDVFRCKKIYANAIDQLNELRNSTDQPGVKRWCSTAITQTELAQMAAVKAITWRD